MPWAWQMWTVLVIKILRVVMNRKKGLILVHAGAVNPATLDPVGRLCRVCGSPNAVIFRLKEKKELIFRINKVLNLSIDLEVHLWRMRSWLFKGRIPIVLQIDSDAGYPGVICRKCCNLVETFFHYKKSVLEGQANLKKQVEEYREKKAAMAEYKQKQAEVWNWSYKFWKQLIIITAW